MPAIYHEGSWLGNATDPEVLVKDTVGWTGKNRAYSQTNNAVIAHIENGITYDVSWTGSATVTLKKNSTSGATITSGSTSPLSFTADADYELYFGSNATVTNIMVKDSRITDPTYEPYHGSVEVMYEEEIHGVNLLKNTAVNKTGGNVAWVVNADKSITINTSESASSVQTLHIGEVTGLQGDYILNGVTGGSVSTYGIQLYDVTTSTWIAQYAVDGDSTINLADKKHTYRFVAYVRQGVSVSNITIRPMLRKATIEDSTYRPYNPQAIQNQLNAQGVLGAKNLCPITANTQTINGVTYTVNRDSDGSVLNVTVNGTATATSVFLLSTRKYAEKNYILSGCPKGGNQDTTYALQIRDTNNNTIIADEGNGGSRALSSDTDYRAVIRIGNGYTVNNLVFKPMLRLASDPDDTYQPYAMTNRELTENKIDKEAILLTSSDDLNNVIDTGLYRWESSMPVNAPENKTWLPMFVTRNNTDVFQLVYKQSTIYQRVRTGTQSSPTWSSWYKFTGTVVS